MQRSFVAALRRPWRRFGATVSRQALPSLQTATMSFQAVPSGGPAQAAALESSGIIVDPYEEAVVKSSMRQRFGYFMMGLAASTQLSPDAGFKAKDFNKDYGNEIMEQFYELYGAQDRDGLRSIVTGPFYAKLKAQMKEEEKNKKNRRRGRKRGRKKSSNKTVSAAAQEDAKLGFKVADIRASNVVQVRTLKGFNKEIAFGQVTSEMDLVLVPSDFSTDATGEPVPFQPPFEVVPDPGRWRRAVDEKGQVSCPLQQFIWTPPTDVLNVVCPPTFCHRCTSGTRALASHSGSDPQTSSRSQTCYLLLKCVVVRFHSFCLRGVVGLMPTSCW